VSDLPQRSGMDVLAVLIVVAALVADQLMNH
jgi:hypothetical protein